MSDSRRRSAARMILGVLFVAAIWINVAPPGRSDHLNATNTTVDAIECAFSNGTAFQSLGGELTKTGVSVGPVLPGESFSYQISLEFSTSANVTARVVDVLPQQFVLGSFPEFEFSGTWSCNEDTGTVTCATGNTSGFAGGVDLFGQVAADAVPGVVTNTAVFEANSSFRGSPFTCSAESTWQFSVVSPANVTADKTVSGDFVLGGTISYVVVLTNSGPAAQVDASGDEFIDVLPPELELDCGATSVVSGGGVLGCDAGTGTVTWNGAIPAGGSVTLGIGATIVAGTPGEPIENQGAFAFDANGDGTHDTNGSTDDPGTPPDPDPTAFVLGLTVSDIPSLGMLGLIALAVLLAAVALPALRD